MTELNPGEARASDKRAWLAFIEIMVSRSPQNENNNKSEIALSPFPLRVVEQQQQNRCNNSFVVGYQRRSTNHPEEEQDDDDRCAFWSSVDDESPVPGSSLLTQAE